MFCDLLYGLNTPEGGRFLETGITILKSISKSLNTPEGGRFLETEVSREFCDSLQTDLNTPEGGRFLETWITYPYGRTGPCLNTPEGGRFLETQKYNRFSN